MYDRVKDHQAAGACIQNMLLAAHALGLGAVWLGQILANKDRVNKVVGLSDQHELAAVCSLSAILCTETSSPCGSLWKFILHEFGENNL